MLCPYRLARSRTPPFHGGDRGSNPLRDAILLRGKRMAGHYFSMTFFSSAFGAESTMLLFVNVR